MSSIVQHAHRFSRQDAVRISKELFGIDAAAEQLPSERDQNFHFRVSNGRDYALKLKFKPPMVFSEENADEVVAILDKVLREDCLQV
jgi:Ser/Thr protein kinase RdoA (MazF antagonist)